MIFRIRKEATKEGNPFDEESKAHKKLVELLDQKLESNNAKIFGEDGCKTSKRICLFSVYFAK